MSEANMYKIDWQQFEKDIHILASNIAKNPVKLRYIYGIPRGGLVIAVRLSHLLKLSFVVEFYHRPYSQNRYTLIVDDVADTGKTLTKWGSFGIATATLYRKDATCIEPAFCVRTINEWIIFPWEAK